MSPRGSHHYSVPLPPLPQAHVTKRGELQLDGHGLAPWLPRHRLSRGHWHRVLGTGKHHVHLPVNGSPRRTTAGVLVEETQGLIYAVPGMLLVPMNC